MGWWQGWASAHRCSSVTMSAHEDVVATVVLQVGHLPASSSGPSVTAGCAILGLQVGRVVPTRIGFHSPMPLAERHRTMESFSAADGLRELQPRIEGGSETFRGNSSDLWLCHLGLET